METMKTNEIGRICARVPVTELLAGLSEEACELGHAALKLRRVFDGSNPTPMPEETAIDNLYEEIADVLLYVETLRINMQSIESIKADKTVRWLERLEK